MNSQIEADIAGAAFRVGQAAEVLAQQLSAYHATWWSVMKPTLSKDGDMWCALHGENLQVGIAGFGPSPANALIAFDIAMCSESGSHVIDRKGGDA